MAASTAAAGDSAWGFPYADPSAADAAVEAEMLECDDRAARNSALTTWVRLASQPTEQLMTASKAHWPWCFVTVPTLPTSVEEFIALRSGYGDSSPETAAVLFLVAMAVFTRDQSVGKQCFVVAVHPRHLADVRSERDRAGSFKNKCLSNGMAWMQVTKRLAQTPYIAWSRFVGATQGNRYDLDALPKLQAMVKDSHVSMTTGTDNAKRAVYVHGRMAAAISLHRNTRGVWKVFDFNAFHSAPMAPAVLDDEDDI